MELLVISTSKCRQTYDYLFIYVIYNYSTMSDTSLRVVDGIIVASDTSTASQLLDICVDEEKTVSADIYKDASLDLESLVKRTLFSTYSVSSLPLRKYLLEQLQQLDSLDEKSRLYKYHERFLHHLTLFDGFYSPKSVGASIIEGFRTVFLQRILSKTSSTLMNHYLGQNMTAIQRLSMNQLR